MGSPTTKTNYHEKNKSGKRRSHPAFPPPRPSPPAEAGAPGSGTAASGAWRGRVWAPQGPARAGGLGRIRWGPPQAAAQQGRPRARDFTLRAGHAFPRASPPALCLHRVYSSALSEPPSRRHPRRLSPALSQPFNRPSAPPGPALGPLRGVQPRRTDSGRARAPCSPDPEPADGGNAAARREPKLRWQRAAWKRGDSLLSARSLRHLVPTCQRPQAPTPLPTRVAEVCNLQPSPRRGSVLCSRDSPPGCGRRCPVPSGSRLPAPGGGEPRRRPRRAGGRSGNGAAAQERPPALTCRSSADATRARARHPRVPPAAAGRAADPPGSAELGSGGSPRSPTSSRPGARLRAGRRR